MRVDLFCFPDSNRNLTKVSLRGLLPHQKIISLSQKGGKFMEKVVQLMEICMAKDPSTDTSKRGIFELGH